MRKTRNSARDDDFNSPLFEWAEVMKGLVHIVFTVAHDPQKSKKAATGIAQTAVLPERPYRSVLRRCASSLIRDVHYVGSRDRRKLQRRLAYLRRRSHVLDAAVMMGTLGGVATSCAALLLFVGTLRDRPGVSLFVAFGLALLFTMGALVAFLIEMLLASRGLRDQANYANEVGEMHELAAEEVGEPNSWRLRLGISTREKKFAFLSGSFVLASRVSAEQPSRKFAPVDAAVGTPNAMLQIAWISSKLHVCSCCSPATKSVYDIEIGFSW